jgi:lipoate-protein ligase A
MKGNIPADTRCDAVPRALFDQLMEVLDPEPHDAAMNMAIDEVLLHHATMPQLRVYHWARPAVSFGYFGQSARVAAQWPERELVRRWTGGGVVLHGEDLTYSLVVPRRCSFFSITTRESYRAIHERIAILLPLARTAESAGSISSDACFENLAQHDLLIAGQKVAGAAQRRTRHGLLHQGSIQSAEANALRASLAETLARHVDRRPLRADEIRAAALLARNRYASEAWLRRF